MDLDSSSCIKPFLKCTNFLVFPFRNSLETVLYDLGKLPSIWKAQTGAGLGVMVRQSLGGTRGAIAVKV